MKEYTIYLGFNYDNAIGKVCLPDDFDEQIFKHQMVISPAYETPLEYNEKKDKIKLLHFGLTQSLQNK